VVLYILAQELENIGSVSKSMRARRFAPINADSARSGGGSRRRAVWRFVYIFFTNGIPFDSPNRSEPCPSPGA
jgi:hypothetical protein